MANYGQIGHIFVCQLSFLACILPTVVSFKLVTAQHVSVSQNLAKTGNL